MAQRAKKIAEENSHHDCDFRDMLSRVGDKWSLLVILISKAGLPFGGVSRISSAAFRGYRSGC